MALIGVFWSYGGWHHASYLAGEAKDPMKVIPRAMIAGALVVMLVYLMTNAAYIRMLGVQGIADSKAVAADAIQLYFPQGALLVAILIAISTFGTAGIYTLTAPRIYYAMAKDRVFFSFLSKVHPRFRVPTNAILLQSIWAAILLLAWQTFENLITYVVFMDWIFMVLAAVSLFVFRYRLGKGGEGYRVSLYPIIPLIFILISVWFIAYTLMARPEQTWAGLGLVALGIPVYLIFRMKNEE